MSDKELVLDAVQQMPQQSSLEAMMASAKGGLAQSDRGEGVTHEEVVKMLGQWITK